MGHLQATAAAARGLARGRAAMPACRGEEWKGRVNPEAGYEEPKLETRDSRAQKPDRVLGRIEQPKPAG